MRRRGVEGEPIGFGKVNHTEEDRTVELRRGSIAAS